MINLRAVAGVFLLCVLAFCAFAASSAYAAKGTTAFTCVKTEKAEFADAHCTKGGTGVGYKHEAIASGQKTNIVISNKNTQNETKESTNAIIKIDIGGMDGEFICPTVNGEGTLTNNAGPPMNVSGTVTITFSECFLSAPGGTFPECKLENPTIVSKASISTPTEGMKVEFVEDGEAFLRFKLTGCKNKPFNIEYQITGSYAAIPSGTTWETSKETSKLQSTGHEASLLTKTTVSMSATEPGIALTTTET